MNAWFNSTDVDSFGSGFRIYKTMNDVSTPGPSQTWVFLDECEDSINDGEFVVGTSGRADAAQCAIPQQSGCALDDGAEHTEALAVGRFAGEC